MPSDCCARGKSYIQYQSEKEELKIKYQSIMNPVASAPVWETKTPPYVESAELSVIGRKRKQNEDSCLRLPDAGIYCVADGIGGAIGGDLASRAIVTSVQQSFAPTRPVVNFSAQVTRFEAALNQASAWIKQYADDQVLGQMGSTVVALVINARNPAQAIGLHAGDSRLYRWREGDLTCLTTDHTAAAALAARLGCLESLLPARYQKELVRAVGLTAEVELERTPVAIRSGDTFLLCSDGLTRMLADAALTEIFKQQADAETGVLARHLIDAANSAGGGDDVTVVLVKIGDISKLAKAPEPLADRAPKPALDAADRPEPLAALDAPRTPSTPDTYQGRTPKTDNDPAAPAPAPEKHEEAARVRTVAQPRDPVEHDQHERELLAY